MTHWSFFFQAEDGIRDYKVTGVQTCALPIGKPVDLGGSLGRVEATGRGVFTVGVEAAKLTGLSVQGARIAVQGFGNVGGTAGKLFADVGAKGVAVQGRSGEHTAEIQAPCNPLC